MAELMCVGGKADGKWVEVPGRRLLRGDHWQVPLMPPLDVNQWDVSQEPVAVNVEVYRIEFYRVVDPRGAPHPHRTIWFLVKAGVDLFDAMVLLFRNYAPESRDDAKPD